MKHAFVLAVVLMVVAGCKQDTRPVPHTYSSSRLYKDYDKQRDAAGYRLTERERGQILARTDLKSTDEHPSSNPADPRPVRFIYGGKFYWAYHDDVASNRDQPQMYGPFPLPRK